MEVTPPRPRWDQESIVANAHRELAALTEELADTVVAVRDRRATWADVEAVLVKIRHLDADARMAGILMGMLSPWLPDVADVPPGTPRQVRARERVEMSIRALSDLVPSRAATPVDVPTRGRKIDDFAAPVDSGRTVALEGLAFDADSMRPESAAYWQGRAIPEDKGNWQSLPKLVASGGKVTLEDGRHRLQEAKRQGKTSVLAVMDVWDKRGNVIGREFVRVALPMPLDDWRFPDLDDAVDWLVNQESIVSADELYVTQQQLHRDAFAMNVGDVETVQRFQTAIAESLRAGESFAEFRKRVGDVAEITRSQQETLYRTNTKQAYLAGQVKALEQPRVKDRFRWVYYASTSDNRTRPTHWALDGMVAEVGSPLHRLFLKRQSEYNCRCTLIPLNERKAESFGVKTLSDVPVAFR